MNTMSAGSQVGLRVLGEAVLETYASDGVCPMDHDAMLVTRAVEAVRPVSTLDEALDSLVRVLAPRFELWNATICSHRVGAPQFTVLTSWLLGAGVSQPDTEVSTTISQTVELMLETLWQGRPAQFSVGTDPDSLVDHLLREQGVESVLALPIFRDEISLVLLTLGSGAKDVFRNAEKGFFTTLGLGISHSILRLASPTSG